MKSKRLAGRQNLDPYDKRANAYGIRFDTPTLKNGINWVSLRKYRVNDRKNWRNLDIDDRFVGRKFNGRLDDFSNAFKDITEPVWKYTRQMRDARRFDVKRTDDWAVPNERAQYFNDPGDGDSWTKGKPAQTPWDSGWLDEQA
jgi:hypothetical protein